MILAAFGFRDSMKPVSSQNLKFELLDQKSIRIMNRLSQYMKNHDHKSILELINKERVYQKVVKNQNSDSLEKGL